jgi:hypothetical protein
MRQIAPELIHCRWSVKCGVIPHSPEEEFALVLILAILAKTFLRECTLGIGS